MEVLGQQSLWRPGISTSSNSRVIQGRGGSTTSIAPRYKPIRAEIQVPSSIHSSKNSSDPEQSAKGDDISKKYYDPKVGDVVLGMVVSGNASKLDVDIGAESLGMMFTRDLVPLDRLSVKDRMWKIDEQAVEDRWPANGRAFLVKDDEILDDMGGGELMVDPGTILQVLVIGKTISGMALLSMRNFCRPIAWQRVRDIYSAEESVEVKIESYNLGGLVCRIEGLTAFLPKDMIQSSPRDITQLKDYVGRTLFVIVVEVDEAKSKILVNERAAWVQQLAPPDSLVQGVVTKVESYGVVVRIDGSDLSALLHISNISHQRIARVADIFGEGDLVKAIVMKPRVPDKVILSTALLEREKGLIITNKQKVFEEADNAFKDWKRVKLRSVGNLRTSKTESSEDELQQPQIAETRQLGNLEWLDIEEK